MVYFFNKTRDSHEMNFPIHIMYLYNTAEEAVISSAILLDDFHQKGNGTDSKMKQSFIDEM